MPVRLRSVLAVAVLMLAGCGAPAGTGTSASSSPAPAPRARVTLTPAEVETAGALIRLEDRREFDAAAFESAAASPTPEIRRRAAMAVGRIRDPRGLPILSRLLADADTSVAATAAYMLGQLGDTAAVRVLIPYVSVDRIAATPTVVGEAAFALGRIPTPEGRRAVEELLRTAPRTGPGVREAVAEALMGVWRFPRPADLSPILPWLDSADPELRWRAAYALTRRPDPRGTEALFTRVADAEPLVRSFAVRSLTRALADSSSVTAARALPALLAATGDADHAVSVNATRSLGTYDAPESVAALERLLAGGDAYLAITAAESLGRLGARARSSAEALARVAADGQRPVFLRTTALASLAEVSPADAGRVAAAFTQEQGWRQRAAAARAFARVGTPRRAELEGLARDTDGRVAAAAIEGAVAAAGDSLLPGLRGLLIESLGHPDVVVRTNALNGLATLGDAATIPVLLDAYARAQTDTLNDAALAAVDALAAVARREPAAARAFLARFRRSGDYLVRQRVAAAFGEAAASWGPPLPIAPGPTSEYRELVERRVAPVLAGGARPRARIETDRGTIEVELFAEDAPLTVANFLSLAAHGYFNGQEWPRVVPNFVVQGGDPRGDTSGGPGYAIRDEMNRHRYLAGTLGMALSGPDTGGSQWFLTHSPQPHLDGTYTVFGRVTRGADVVGRILPGDRILRIQEVR